MSTLPAWTQWWQDDIPCHFSAEQASENAAYLTQLLGESFLAGALHPIAQVKHPVLERWRTCGAGAFLELNALAMDLREVETVEGLDTVLNDLRDRDTCLSTWHTVHSAALLSRPAESCVVRFYPQTDESLPDFLLSSAGERVACEAKLLAKSGQEEAFEAYASGLSQEVLTRVVAAEEVHPTLTVVLKDVGNLPPTEDVVEALKTTRESFSGETLKYRSQAFNLFIERSEYSAPGVSVQRSCYILCPKSEKEDLRVHRPGSKASKQLSATTTAEHPGMLLLGVTRLQEPAFVADLFRRRFAVGRYPGISGVILIQSATYMQPPVRAPLDLVGSFRNKLASKQLPNIPLGPVGLLAGFPVRAGSIPAYNHLVQEARMGQGGSISMSALRDLEPHMLSND